MKKESEQQNPTDTNKPFGIDGVTKRYLFTGTLQMSGQPFSIEIDAIDRESAIAYVEVSYPTFKWYVTSEL